MLKKLSHVVLNFGFGIAIGAIGFISAFAGIFLDLTKPVSMTWLIGIAWISITAVIVLLKVIHDGMTKPPSALVEENVVSYDSATQVLMVRSNPNFTNQVLVAGYHIRGEIEELIFVGAVHHVQPMMVQLRILLSFKEFDVVNNYRDVVVRPTVPAHIFKNPQNEG